MKEIKQTRRRRQREFHLKCNFAFLQSFLSYSKSLRLQNVFYPIIKLEPTPQRWEDKIRYLSSYAHVVHTTVKQVISRRGKIENGCEMSKLKWKTIIFHCQICKCVVFLLPFSSWSLISSLLFSLWRQLKNLLENSNQKLPNNLNNSYEKISLCVIATTLFFFL